MGDITDVATKQEADVAGEIEGIRKDKPIPRVQQINRQQLILRPMDIEQLVPEDHEVRAIWEFVGQMDLSRYYEEQEQHHALRVETLLSDIREAIGCMAGRTDAVLQGER